MSEQVQRSTALVDFRTSKDEFFRRSPHSPIPAHDRAGFGGLEYYEERPDLAFTVPLHPADGEVVTMQTSDGRERPYRRAATATFQVDGGPVTVTLYDTGHQGLFLPFRDATSGKETYGAGRYLDLDPSDDGTVTIDFNYAYNPSCAYDDAYSCPLPPVENWLRVRIRAGEKDYAH